MRKPASSAQLGGVDFSLFVGGQIQVREACRHSGDLIVGKHPDFRCEAALFQGKIQRLQIVEENLQARVEWFAKNEGCPGIASPRWAKCNGSIWQWSVEGVKESSVIRNDIASLVEILLSLTDRRLIFFQKGYVGNEYGGLVIEEQVVVAKDYASTR